MSMKVVIIEDEKLAAERLMYLLNQYDPNIQIVEHLYSVSDSVHYLLTMPHPDVIFMDIQLSDGICFDIFHEISYQKPIIFTTAYDQYALQAFKQMSIDYLIKPIGIDSLFSAMEKLKKMLPAKEENSLTLFDLVKTMKGPSYKKRFMSKIGRKIYFVEDKDISHFQADDKIVYLVDKEGKKLPIEFTMEKLETSLDPKQYFRLNRSFLVRYNSIKQAMPYLNSRLKISLSFGAGKTEDVIIARERVSKFRIWADQN